MKNLETIVSQLIARAWNDEEFYQNFISNPTEMLREAGLILGDLVKVVVNTGINGPLLQTAEGANIYEINMPARPENLSTEQLSLLMQAGEDSPVVPMSCS